MCPRWPAQFSARPSAVPLMIIVHCILWKELRWEFFIKVPSHSAMEVLLSSCRSHWMNLSDQERWLEMTNSQRIFWEACISVEYLLMAQHQQVLGHLQVQWWSNLKGAGPSAGTVVIKSLKCWAICRYSDDPILKALGHQQAQRWHSPGPIHIQDQQYYWTSSIYRQVSARKT